MRLFLIKNEDTNKDTGYLFYYEKTKKFYIELPENADPWEMPLLLDTFIKKGIKTVNSYWSKVWVQQRIIPTDRQNIGQILKDNGLTEYDEFGLLMLSMGRCAQDELYLEEISEKDLPESIQLRSRYKVEDVVALEQMYLLVFFRDGTVKKCDVSQVVQGRRFMPVRNSEPIFQTVSVQVGGYGVCWGEQLMIPDKTLFDLGQIIPLSSEDFFSFVKNRVITTSEAAELLDCSRQNILDLMNRGKLHPVKSSERSILFLKSEIMKRMWE